MLISVDTVLIREVNESTGKTRNRFKTVVKVFGIPVWCHIKDQS